MYTFWLAGYQCVRVRTILPPLSVRQAKASLSEGAMCLCAWARAHPRSRHPYNSIRPGDGVGTSPSQNTRWQNVKRGGESETCGAVMEDEAISEQRFYASIPHATPIHLLCFTKAWHRINVLALTAAEGPVV